MYIILVFLLPGDYMNKKALSYSVGHPIRMEKIPGIECRSLASQWSWDRLLPLPGKIKYSE